ncbi:hypothetical protein EDC04DRAFT_2841544 [Pisolithus marmoratus]|nr:hypothetical protein EDC04DRAFT_2841544 [Pisolithus marmoratus]
MLSTASTNPPLCIHPACTNASYSRALSRPAVLTKTEDYVHRCCCSGTRLQSLLQTTLEVWTTLSIFSFLPSLFLCRTCPTCPMPDIISTALMLSEESNEPPSTHQNVWQMSQRTEKKSTSMLPRRHSSKTLCIKIVRALQWSLSKVAFTPICTRRVYNPNVLRIFEIRGSEICVSSGNVRLVSPSKYDNLAQLVLWVPSHRDLVGHLLKLYDYPRTHAMAQARQLGLDEGFTR